MRNGRKVKKDLNEILLLSLRADLRAHNTITTYPEKSSSRLWLPNKSKVGIAWLNELWDDCGCDKVCDSFWLEPVKLHDPLRLLHIIPNFFARRSLTVFFWSTLGCPAPCLVFYKKEKENINISIENITFKS